MLFACLAWFLPGSAWLGSSYQSPPTPSWAKHYSTSNCPPPKSKNTIHHFNINYHHQLPLCSTLPLPALLYLAVDLAGHVPLLRGLHTSLIAPSLALPSVCPVFRTLAWLSSWRCYSSHRRIHRQDSGCVTWPTVVAAVAALRKPDYNEGHGLSCRATFYT